MTDRHWTELTDGDGERCGRRKRIDRDEGEMAHGDGEGRTYRDEGGMEGGDGQFF